MLAALLRNRAFLEPWEPARPESDFTLEGQMAAMHSLVGGRAAGTTYGFGIRVGDAGELAGGITLSQVFRKNFQSCYLGYWVGEAHNGRGVGSEAVRLVVAQAFEVLELHRIQANVMPKNSRSARILEKAGFRKEGRALRYLRIAGQWEDHDMFAITSEDVARPES